MIFRKKKDAQPDTTTTTTTTNQIATHKRYLEEMAQARAHQAILNPGTTTIPADGMRGTIGNPYWDPNGGMIVSNQPAPTIQPNVWQSTTTQFPWGFRPEPASPNLEDCEYIVIADNMLPPKWCTSLEEAMETAREYQGARTQDPWASTPTSSKIRIFKVVAGWNRDWAMTRKDEKALFSETEMKRLPDPETVSDEEEEKEAVG